MVATPWVVWLVPVRGKASRLAFSAGHIFPGCHPGPIGSAGRVSRPRNRICRILTDGCRESPVQGLLSGGLGCGAVQCCVLMLSHLPREPWQGSVHTYTHARVYTGSLCPGCRLPSHSVSSPRHFCLSAALSAVSQCPTCTDTLYCPVFSAPPRDLFSHTPHIT